MSATLTTSLGRKYTVADDVTSLKDLFKDPSRYERAFVEVRIPGAGGTRRWVNLDHVVEWTEVSDA